MLSKVAVVTNCFPPKFGGIETFVHQLALALPVDSILVIAPADAKSTEFDESQPFTVARLPWRNIFPSRSVANTIADIAKKHGCTRLLLSELFPLGLMSAPLRAAGFKRIVSLSHGAEAAWSKLPFARSLVRRAAKNVDAITYLSDDIKRNLCGVTEDETKFHQLTPGVDANEFSPKEDGSALRSKLGLEDAQIILCVSRLVPRKGQDKLIQAMPSILQECPKSALLLAGVGPDEKRLQKLRESSPAKSRIITLGEVPREHLPTHYAAADLFAMPCRSRFGGLELEGFGIVYLEAAASGLAVVAGQSGGVAEAVTHGDNGLLVDGSDCKSITKAIVRLLKDEGLRSHLGNVGRQKVLNHFTWDLVAGRLSALLWPEQADLHRALDCR